MYDSRWGSWEKATDAAFAERADPLIDLSASVVLVCNLRFDARMDARLG